MSQSTTGGDGGHHGRSSRAEKRGLHDVVHYLNEAEEKKHWAHIFFNQTCKEGSSLAGGRQMERKEEGLIAGIKKEGEGRGRTGESVVKKINKAPGRNCLVPQ